MKQKELFCNGRKAIITYTSFEPAPCELDEQEYEKQVARISEDVRKKSKLLNDAEEVSNNFNFIDWKMG